MHEKKAPFSIKNWSQNDRPREKLLNKGKTILSDSELLAILIGSGNRNESAVALCKRICASVDHNLQALSKLSAEQLMNFKGIGEAKAITIVAALELGKRSGIVAIQGPVKIASSVSVFNLLRLDIGALPHEEFWVIFLNNSNIVLQKIQISKGGITGTLVDVRLVLKKALELNATGIILAHNHPSGGLNPSVADKQLTKKLQKAAEQLDIKVLDHLIITEHEYVSFADENLL